MLIIDEAETWTAITQPAHAWLAGQIARVWGNERFAKPEPFEDVCLGVEQHDVAWVGYDLRPTLFEGRAASFLEAPFGERTAIWAEAPGRMLAQSPYAALLVSLHGTNIHTRYVDPSFLADDDAALVRGYLEAQRELQDRLIALLGVERAQAERQAELLFCVDALSLRLCHGWPEGEQPPVDGVAVRYAPVGEGVATLDPWPLGVDEVTVGVDARTLTQRFEDEAALHAGLAGARPERRRFTLRRG